MHDSDDSALQFPCRFPIKAMGRAEADFDALVLSLVQQHAPELGEGDVSTRASRGGKYLSVTVVVQASSREQLDDIYRTLTAHERVLMAL